MTSQDRKRNTEAYLKELDIPFNAVLPAIEEESEALIRSAADIARRILILAYLGLYAYNDRYLDCYQLAAQCQAG